MPPVKRFLKEKVKSFFRSKVKDQQHSIHHDLEAILIAAEEPTDSKVSSENPSTDIVIAKEQQTMSIDEAKARLILAAMGRAYTALLKQIRQTEVHVIDNRQLPRSRTENQLKRIDEDNS